MNATKIFSRALVAFLAVCLMAGIGFGQNLNLNGAATYSGTWKVKGNINNTSSTGANTFTGTVELKGTGAQSIGGAANAIDFATLTATGVSAKSFTTASTVATAVDITASGASFVVAASKKLTLQGTIANTAGGASPYDFTASGAEVDYAGAAQTVFSGVTYDKLTISTAGTKSMNGAVTVASALAVSNGDFSLGANTLTIDGTYTISSGSVVGGTTSNMVLGGTGNVASFAVTNGLNNLTLNRDTYTVTLGGGLNLEGALALNNGTLAVSTQTLTLKGSVSAVGSGALTSAATGTVDYNTGTQTVLASNYGNLSFTAGNKTLPSSGTVGIAGTFTPGAGTHTVTGSTVDFNGAAQNIPLFTFNNLTTSGGAVTKTATGNVTVGGNFDNGGTGDAAVTLDMSTYALAITGTSDNTSAKVQFSGTNNGVLFTTGTVEYNAAAGDQVIKGNATFPGTRYATLLLSGGGTKTVKSSDNNVATDAGVTVASGVELVVDATRELWVGYTSGDLTINGTVTNNGTITVGN